MTGFGLYGTALILPLFFQNVLGFSATQTGMALLPGAIATATRMPIASQLIRRIDGRREIAFGLLIFAVSAWWMGGINQNAGYWDVFWPRAMQGFALGFMFVPLTTVDARRDHPREDGQRDRHLHAACASSAGRSDRDPAAAADALPGHRLRGARLRRDAGEPQRRARTCATCTARAARSTTW